MGNNMKTEFSLAIGTLVLQLISLVLMFDAFQLIVLILFLVFSLMHFFKGGSQINVVLTILTGLLQVGYGIFYAFTMATEDKLNALLVVVSAFRLTAGIIAMVVATFMMEEMKNP
jgi:hypothetical protein